MSTRTKDRKPKPTRVSVSEAAGSLDAIVERVHGGKQFVVLEKNGTPVAVLMDIGEFEDYLELQDPEVNRNIAESNQEYLEGKSRPAEELLAELETEEASEGKRTARVDR